MPFLESALVIAVGKPLVASAAVWIKSHVGLTAVGIAGGTAAATLIAPAWKDITQNIQNSLDAFNAEYNTALSVSQSYVQAGWEYLTAKSELQGWINAGLEITAGLIGRVARKLGLDEVTTAFIIGWLKAVIKPQLQPPGV